MLQERGPVRFDVSQKPSVPTEEIKLIGELPPLPWEQADKHYRSTVEPLLRQQTQELGYKGAQFTPYHDLTGDFPEAGAVVQLERTPDETGRKVVRQVRVSVDEKEKYHVKYLVRGDGGVAWLPVAHSPEGVKFQRTGREPTLRQQFDIAESRAEYVPEILVEQSKGAKKASEKRTSMYEKDRNSVNQPVAKVWLSDPDKEFKETAQRVMLEAEQQASPVQPRRPERRNEIPIVGLLFSALVK